MYALPCDCRLSLARINRHYSIGGPETDHGTSNSAPRGEQLRIPHSLLELPESETGSYWFQQKGCVSRASRLHSVLRLRPRRRHFDAGEDGGARRLCSARVLRCGLVRRSVWLPISLPPLARLDGVRLSNGRGNPLAVPRAVQGVESFPAGRIDAVASTWGFLITATHILLGAGAVVLLDTCYLRRPFVLTSPFILSAALAGFSGYLVVPVLRYLKAAQVLRLEGPNAHFVKFGTPTMGGVFFVPVGVTIAEICTGFSSHEVHCATIVTLAFAGIGMVDDSQSIRRQHNYGLNGWLKLTLQVVVGVFLYFLMSSILSPANKLTQNAVWLPNGLRGVPLGKWYLPLTAFCCAAMGNGVNLSDGLDGLAGGTAACAFIAMSAASLPHSSALGVFGSSMAGACFGFLLHNRHKAKVFMGDTGSLALGGALAAMACLTGMFVPLFIASGVFVIETLSVMGQVLYFKMTRKMYGNGRRWLRMAPFHHHLELLGLQEPLIVALAYTLSLALASIAAGLVLKTS